MFISGFFIVLNLFTYSVIFLFFRFIFGSGGSGELLGVFSEGGVGQDSAGGGGGSEDEGGPVVGLVVGQYRGGGRTGFMVSMSWFCGLVGGFRGGGREEGPGGVLVGGVVLLCAGGSGVSSRVFTAWCWRLVEGFQGGRGKEEEQYVGGGRGFSLDSLAWNRGV